MSRVLLNANNEIKKKYNPFFHRGIDIVKYKSKITDVLAHSDGVVVEKVYHKKYGNLIKIKHHNGMFTIYGHLENVNVSVEDYVKRGSVIGLMGKSGKTKNCHLHFEIRNQKNRRINPLKYLDNDLPNNQEKNKITYQVYDNRKRKWLKKVSEVYDYAGIIGNPIGALLLNIDNGNIKYRVHNKDWQEFVFNDNDYAGKLNENIDGIHIVCETSRIMYRVHLYKGEWMPWLTNEIKFYNRKIDGIQIIIKED